MFAINHAAAALLVHHRYRDVPLWLILFSVQAMELLWVVLNLAGVERTTTASAVRYVGDINLEFMPYSHSVATMIGAAGLGWMLGTLLGKPRVGAAFGLGVASHLILDLATHDGDIVLGPLSGGEGLGTHLYGTFPMAAFLAEIAFGIACWWVYRGRRALLAVIVGFNLANLSIFFASVSGPEAVLAGRPKLLVMIIFVQIILTLVAVWWGASGSATYASEA